MPKDSKRSGKLSNGRTLQPGATPLGVATCGEIGLFGTKWYDNNGDRVDSPAGGPMEKYAKGSDNA